MLILLGVVAVAGCRGEATDEDEAKREAAQKALKEKKEPPKEPYEFQTLDVRPSEADRIGAAVKPGHWTTAALKARANHGDFHGELVTEMLLADGSPAELDGIPAHVLCSRPSILPKGQYRSLAVDLLLPVRNDTRQVGVRLLAGPGGRELLSSREMVLRMPAHQYYFVVLSGGPDKYRYLQSLDSVRAPMGESDENTKEHHYRVLLPAIKNEAPLPPHALYWTTVAYVLWDNLDLSTLSADQRTAMLDWLHWGGQIIVSGPDSLDALRGSFLEPYLPVTGGDTWSIDQDVVADLNRRWSHGGELKVPKPWSGQKLKPKEGAEQSILAASPAGEPLVVEGHAGAGRIVVTAFRLSQRDLVDWRGMDGFFNACLLRRGPRRFKPSPEFKLAVNWLDGDRYDPRRTTRVRYFTRDADAANGTLVRTDGFREGWFDATGMGNQQLGGMGWMDTGSSAYPPEPPTGAGVAGWNDTSPASELARQSLREAAGIEVPKSSFVLSILGAYIIVLVPINWFLFSRLGRVEWAWVAAPLVAIVFGLLVVWLAQVNIGFARSATEVGVLEVQGGYGRGHLTRYTALYSSLSTRYDVSLADPGGAVLPMPARTDRDFLQSRSTMTLRRLPGGDSDSDDEEAALTLQGFLVSSNSTGMVHSEQMLDLGGAIGFELLSSSRCRVRNGTRYALKGAGLIHESASGWVGDIAPGQEVTVELASRNGRKSYFREWDSSQVTAARPSPGELNLRPLLALACDQTAAGQTRLVAWTDEEILGLAVRPGAAQHHRATLVVANLIGSPESPPQRDKNARADFPATGIDADATLPEFDEQTQPGAPTANQP